MLKAIHLLSAPAIDHRQSYLTKMWSAALGILTVAHGLLAAEISTLEDPPFQGKIATSVEDAVAVWPQPAKAPPEAPNIVIVLLDDIGFADASTFGGLIDTSELDNLAAVGLRYINFNTAAMCSPTRAALLTGRNHHRVGFGVAEAAAGFPGYNFIWKKSTASIPEILSRNGYSTAVFGKWHNTPLWEISPIGPFDRWPTGLGFDYFYGFMAGMENQWEPSRLYRSTIAVEASATVRQGYHLTTDIAEEAIRWLHTHASIASEKPYFLYFAPGAVHGPHHAPREWIDRYRGRFDEGWDKLRERIFSRQQRLSIVPVNAKLTPRPEEIPAWKTLSADQRRLYARQMEVYAGFVAHTDHEIGRVLKAVQQGPRGDNTLILYIVGDNGSDGLSGLNGLTDGEVTVADQLRHIEELGSSRFEINSYSRGWAWLGSTPFRGWKAIASHFGAVRSPMVVSWPARIQDRGGLRSQFTHVTDVAATLYAATGIRFPTVVDGVKQSDLDGVSFLKTFDTASAPSMHHRQYFEMIGNRAIYQDGWVAAAHHGVTLSTDFAKDRWELYHVDQDFTQAHDLSKKFPDRLKKLQELFDMEARRNDVYPLGAVFGATSPALTDGKSEFVYFQGMPRIPETAMPPLSGRSYRIEAEAVIPMTGAEGVILSYGGRESGFALYLKDGRLFFENNYFNKLHETIVSNVPVPHGHTKIAYEFTKEGARGGESLLDAQMGGVSWGSGRLFINGKVVGEAKVTGVTLLKGAGPGSLGIGRAFGSPVSDSFRPPFEFSGTLGMVAVQLR